MTSDHVIFMQFEAMPTQAVAERDNVAGAHVNCWIQARDPDQAEATMRHVLGDQGIAPDYAVVRESTTLLRPRTSAC